MQLKLNSNTLNGIWIQVNYNSTIGLRLNWIEWNSKFNLKKKMDANWWKMYSKSSCEYGVGK